MTTLKVRVGGPFEVLGRRPGEVFDLDYPDDDPDALPPEREANERARVLLDLLLEAGSLERVTSPRNQEQ